ncbi:DUF6776 family protein [Candidatus Foliamicus sp.]
MLGQNKVLVWRGLYSAALCALLIAALVAGGASGWWLHTSAMRDRVAAMQARIDSLELRNLELSQMIDEETLAALRAQVRNLQGEVMNQRMTIYGLQEIITPQEARAGLRIHSVDVEPGVEEQDYRLSVGLAQALLAKSSRARGHVELLLTGSLDGDGAELSLGEISKRKTERIEFNFQSSTVLRADMTLPYRFEPSTIRVRITPVPDEQLEFEREFPWAPRAPNT